MFMMIPSDSNTFLSSEFKKKIPFQFQFDTGYELSEVVWVAQGGNRCIGIV